MNKNRWRKVFSKDTYWNIPLRNEISSPSHWAAGGRPVCLPPLNFTFRKWSDMSFLQSDSSCRPIWFSDAPYVEQIPLLKHPTLQCISENSDSLLAVELTRHVRRCCFLGASNYPNEPSWPKWTQNEIQIKPKCKTKPKQLI